MLGRRSTLRCWLFGHDFGPSVQLTPNFAEQQIAVARCRRCGRAAVEGVLDAEMAAELLSANHDLLTGAEGVRSPEGEKQ